MNVKKHEAIALTTAAVLIGLSYIASRHIPDRFQAEHLRCAIELGANDLKTGRLTGFNYFLLEKFAADHGKTLDIVVSRKGDSYVDSLRNGAIDLVVIPYSDAIMNDDVQTSIPIDSASLWLVPTKEILDIRILNKWIFKYHHTAEYKETRDLYLKIYEPIRAARAGKKMHKLSPYDDIIREYADSLGWDWKFLTAVIFQESQFRIDARSHRGAIGLMQMTPYTAGKWCDGDIVDPRQNIKAGTQYLKYLSGLYYRVASDRNERMKFTIAAYNAGPGRVRDIINFARSRGVDVSHWDSVAFVMPGMRDPNLVAAAGTVELGTFNGKETTTYVSRVLELYEAFNKLYREE